LEVFADLYIMLGQSNGLTGRCGVQVILDGEELQVPEWVGESLPAIRAYLESLALKQDRAVVALSVDGQSVSCRDDFAGNRDFRSVCAETISFEELSKQVIESAGVQVGVLQTQVESAAMQVLINDWATIEKLWQEWAPAFSSPVLIVKYLRDMCGRRVDELCIGRKTLGKHMEEFGQVWKGIELAFAQRDTFELSNILERLLVPWLEQLSAYLTKLNEQ
jgi:hypothetical protein